MYFSGPGILQSLLTFKFSLSATMTMFNITATIVFYVLQGPPTLLLESRPVFHRSVVAIDTFLRILQGKV